MRLYTIAKIDRAGRELGRVRVFAQTAEIAFASARSSQGWSAGSTLVVLKVVAA